MPPTAPPPRPVRPLFKMAMATLNPLPSASSMLPAGILTSEKFTVVVEEARIPILSSCCPWLTPGHAASTTNAVILPAGDDVRANTVYRSAMPPLVIHIFSPFKVQEPSGFLTAWVRIDAASEPAPDSVRQNAAIISPLASFGR